ncbi:MAG: hypothetical protein AB1746_06875 [Candidatus Zixiibacteriota bacterium]
MKAKGWLVLIVLTLALTFPLLVNADTMIRQVNERGAFEVMGQKVPACSDTSVVWLGKAMSRMDEGDTASVIMLAEKNIIYMIDHKAKTYAEMPMDALGDLTKMFGNNEEAKQQIEAMKPMMEMMRMAVTVTPTTETQKIGDWNCTKYNVKMTMGMGGVSDIEMWATEDAKIDYAAFMELTNSFKGMLPGFEEMMEEMKKVKGIPIKTSNKMNIMGAEATSVMQVIEIKDMDAPAGTYELPKGYTKTEMGMPGMGG